MSRCELLVIGAGPSGVAAAVQARRLLLDVRLVDRTGSAGGLVGEAYCVENYPGLPPMPGAALVERLAEHLRRFEVPVERANVRSLRILPSGSFEVSLDSGICEARNVIVATGTEARKLAAPWLSPHDEGEVWTTMSHALRDPGLREQGSAVIVGGGEASFDYALSLASRGYGVTLLLRGDTPRARGRLVRQVLDCSSISLWRSAVIESGRRVGGIWHLEIRCGGDCLPVTTGALVAAIGRTSRVGTLLTGLDLLAATGITTPWPGLFVVGDARSGSLGQVGMAVGDGLAAAMQAVPMGDVERRTASRCSS